mgnify:CR=1 FL=1|jgi:hypothetical protein
MRQRSRLFPLNRELVALTSSLQKCSRAGCVAQAVTLLEWRNPTVHSPDRIKTWASCDEHLEFLTAYLDNRGFFLGMRPLAETSEVSQ